MTTANSQLHAGSARGLTRRASAAGLLSALAPLLLSGACATSQPAASPTVNAPVAPVAASGTAPVAAPAGEPASTGSDLHGDWVQYWAVRGGADTEGYSFTDAGRFVWRAAEKAQAPNTAIHKDGTYSVESLGSARQLVLRIETERFAPCGAPCAQGGEPREVHHATPLTESYDIGACPENPEARELDASYTCRAIGGKTFWRKS